MGGWQVQFLPSAAKHRAGIETRDHLRRGRVLTFGFNAFPDKAGSVAVISKVALADPKGIKTLAAWIVPITGHDLYGLALGLPPARHLDPGVQWGQRERADGARVPPSRESNIVLVLKLTARKGLAEGIDVFYRVGGAQYHLRTQTKVALGNGYCP